MRRVEPGDLVGGQPITIEPAIEIGNIFKLGRATREALGATYLDENGREQPIWMGSYGIGPARIVAAAVEQFADEHGISWPRALAPSRCTWWRSASRRRPSARPPSGSTDAARGGIEVLYDDRDAGPGEKFADAELLGCPLRLTVGRRSLESGEIEVQRRRGRARRAGLAARGRAARAAAGGGGAVAGRPGDGHHARLLGLDRSGPPPPQTRAGHATAARGRCRTRSGSCASR